MSRKGPEATLEADLRKHMIARGGIFPKSVSPGNRGWPDRNPCHFVSGPFYMELKARGKKSTPQQMKVSREMAAHGCRVYASVDNLIMGKAIIDDEVDGVPPRLRRYQPVSADG